LEARHDLDFLEEIHELPGGERIMECIQCGTCSGSCPSAYMMDHTPRQLFAMIRAGMRREVLSSSTPWLCASCYLCPVRCPSKIKITDVMYALKRLVVREGIGPGGRRAATLSRLFVENINKYGRNHEFGLLFRYFARADQLGALKNMTRGWTLLRKGRLPLTPSRIQGIDQIRRILATVESLGEVGGE
jgi:heterodisulfide reductase subunit C